LTKNFVKFKLDTMRNKKTTKLSIEKGTIMRQTTLGAAIEQKILPCNIQVTYKKKTYRLLSYRKLNTVDAFYCITFKGEPTVYPFITDTEKFIYPGTDTVTIL